MVQGRFVWAGGEGLRGFVLGVQGRMLMGAASHRCVRVVPVSWQVVGVVQEGGPWQG